MKRQHRAFVEGGEDIGERDAIRWPRQRVSASSSLAAGDQTRSDERAENPSHAGGMGAGALGDEVAGGALFALVGEHSERVERKSKATGDRHCAKFCNSRSRRVNRSAVVSAARR